jgi:hypothetical protein
MRGFLVVCWFRSEQQAKDAVLYHYRHAASGFSAKLTPQQVEELKSESPPPRPSLILISCDSVTTCIIVLGHCTWEILQRALFLFAFAPKMPHGHGGSNPCSICFLKSQRCRLLMLGQICVIG